MFEQLKNQWRDTSSSSRIGLVVGLFLIVILLTVGSYILLRDDDYRVLFSDLTPQDAAAMVDELERMKVPHKIADDGTTIMVGEAAVYKTRLKLMGKGLNLNGSVGFEIFNNSEFGMTEFAQKVNYQRALQGELARTIMGFDEVKTARVHLVLPESGLFKRQTAKPKASVSVQLKNGYELTPEQVVGIQRLVAASVPEILPAEVTVVDHRGVAVTKLNNLQTTDGVNALHDRLDVKKQLEEYMTRKVIAVVDKAVGPGKAIVSVDVSLNYDQIKITKEDIVPLAETNGQEVGAVVRRRESVQGDDSYMQPGALGQAKGGNWTPSSSSTEIEFANSKRIEQVLSSPGNISRLNVGVLVPDGMDPIVLEKLKEMIGAVVGVDVNRGDGLVVYGIDSLGHKSVEEGSETSSEVQKDDELDEPTNVTVPSGANIPLNRYWWIGLVGVLVLFVLIYFLIQRGSQKKLSAQEKRRLLADIEKWARDARGI